MRNSFRGYILGDKVDRAERANDYGHTYTSRTNLDTTICVLHSAYRLALDAIAFKHYVPDVYNQQNLMLTQS